MNVLVAGAACRLRDAVASELAKAHRIRLLGGEITAFPAHVGDATEIIEGSILDSGVAARVVVGMEAVILTGKPPRELPKDELERDQHLLDLATRGTHVLLKAAVEAGVKRIVYASTLRLFRAYPDDVYISECWEPRPTPGMDEMAPYLAERVCREFARAHPVTVTVLRLGELVLEEEVRGSAPDLMWLDIRDAARAIGWALDRDASSDVWWTRRYTLYHICASIPNAKFLTAQAAAKGFEPVHNFEAFWAAPGPGSGSGGMS